MVSSGEPVETLSPLVLPKHVWSLGASNPSYLIRVNPSLEKRFLDASLGWKLLNIPRLTKCQTLLPTRPAFKNHGSLAVSRSSCATITFYPSPSLQILPGRTPSLSVYRSMQIPLLSLSPTINLPPLLRSSVMSPYCQIRTPLFLL